MSYRKGYSLEREIKLQLEELGFTVIRSAGSKKPDLIAGRDGSIYVIECKAKKSQPVYIDTDEIEKLHKAAKDFNAQPMVCIKINNKPMQWLSPSWLGKTKEKYVWNEKEIDS